jgi:hypothetical protein
MLRSWTPVVTLSTFRDKPCETAALNANKLIVIIYTRKHLSIDCWCELFCRVCNTQTLSRHMWKMCGPWKSWLVGVAGTDLPIWMISYIICIIWERWLRGDSEFYIWLVSINITMIKNDNKWMKDLLKKMDQVLIL